MNTSIGAKIRLARKQAGLTQKKFGEQLGKSGATVAYIEQGQRRVNAELLKNIARLLQKPLSYFYEEENDTDLQLRQQLFHLQKQLDGIQELLKQTRLEKEEAEADLQLFRRLLDNSNDLIAVWDPETGAAIDCNQKVCESSGYSREEFLQKRIMDVEPGIPNLDVWKECVQEAKKQGFLIIQTRPREKSGKRGHVEVNVKYVQLEEKDFMVVIAREITERKQHEEMARQQTQRYQALLESSPVAVISCDDQGEVLRANDKLFELLDTDSNSTKQLTKKHLEPLRNAGLFEHIEACLQEGKPMNTQIMLELAQKKPRSLSVELVPTNYTGYITGVQVVLKEITP